MRNKNRNVKYKVAITNNKATIMRHEVTITLLPYYFFYSETGVYNNGDNL